MSAKKIWKKPSIIVIDIGKCRYCQAEMVNTESFVAFYGGDKAHYECMLDGYIKSHDKILEIGRSEINTHGIYVKFDCSQVILPKPKPGIES